MEPSRYYDKDKLKQSLELEQVYDLLELWGGEPEYSKDGLIAQTICHNEPGEGSRKLYYYANSQLFHCYTGCLEPSFDVFDLCIKVMKRQKSLKWELYDAMDFIAGYFGFEGAQLEKNGNPQLKDWDIFKKHNYKLESKKQNIQLKQYDDSILERFAYPRIYQWEREGITPEAIKKHLIGYYPGGEQITIPHFDINNRLIGIRGRTLAQDQAERFGKYRPLTINNLLYTHPLSMNLYNLNNSKDNIRRKQVALLFESEKSCLQYSSFYGEKEDISIAVCGSSLSNYQIELLRSVGAKELVIGFDRQFQEIGDEEFKRLVNKLKHIHSKYHNYLKISLIFDKNMITKYKASPTDEGKEKFEQLLKDRIYL